MENLNVLAREGSTSSFFNSNELHYFEFMTFSKEIISREILHETPGSDLHSNGLGLRSYGYFSRASLLKEPAGGLVPNKISGVGTNFGQLVIFFLGPNKQRACKLSMLLN